MRQIRAELRCLWTCQELAHAFPNLLDNQLCEGTQDSLKSSSKGPPKGRDPADFLDASAPAKGELPRDSIGTQVRSFAPYFVVARLMITTCCH